MFVLVGGFFFCISLHKSISIKHNFWQVNVLIIISSSKKAILFVRSLHCLVTCRSLCQLVRKKTTYDDNSMIQIGHANVFALKFRHLNKCQVDIKIWLCNINNWTVDIMIWRHNDLKSQHYYSTYGAKYPTVI